jgi:hypothetical protein
VRVTERDEGIPSEIQVDTARQRWKDSGDGTGVVPDQTFLERLRSDDATPSAKPASGPTEDHVSDYSVDSMSSASYSAESDLDDNEDTHYAGLPNDNDRGWLSKKVKGVTPAGIRKELLRKTVRYVFPP